MVVEEQRVKFQEELGASHAAFQTERDRQYEIYKVTCRREQGVRDRLIAALPPTDEGGIAIAHEDYDKEVSRASKIFKRYEERTWRKHMDEAAALRRQYGIPEEVT